MTTNLTARITEHSGRWWHAWPRDGRWYAPTPSLGGGYVGGKRYVCSGAALSWDTRDEAESALTSGEVDGIAYDSIEEV